MNLYLSHHSPLNCTLSNEHGQALYKVETPRKLLGRTVATISYVVPNSVPRGAPSPSPKAVQEAYSAAQVDNDKVEEADLQDRYALLGQVEYHFFGTSTLRFGGNEYKTTSYFRKEGMGFYGRYVGTIHIEYILLLS